MKCERYASVFLQIDTSIRMKRGVKKEITVIAKAFCKKCKKIFGLDSDYIGVVTCPYCGVYVEG